MNSWRERSFHLPHLDCIHFTFINFERVGVLHASVSLWGYSLSCGIPIELIIQISYIQIELLKVVVDYSTFAK